MKKKGSELKIGDRVKFTPSGWHTTVTAEVFTNEVRLFLWVKEPEFLKGAVFGLWPDHNYIILP